ncbi:MAG TPA: hypothetical protein VFT16_02175 [Candidatus Saccharimonadales bacterium]|nr:hypothetical protein [Candidatus Saccharimonadales bacterium]
MAKQASDNQLQESPEAPPVRPHHRMWHWTKTHKKVAIPAAIVVVAGLLAGIPFTRYALAGVILKQTYTVTVLDQQTNKPVSSATVMLKGEQAKTDSKGKASLKTAVGNGRLTVEKKYYAAAKKTVLVPIFKQKDVTEIKIRATGRQVPVTVINKISKRPLANAKVAALGAEVKTDAKGQALLVLPADKQKVMASVSAAGYNEAKAEVTVTTEIVAENTYSMTPAGKIYFMSRQSGKYDLVKTNLDGTDRQVVLAGTGTESADQLGLSRSSNGSYIALHARRDSGNPKLYLIDTQNDEMSVMDEGNAEFTVKGWAGDFYIYSVTRKDKNMWEAKRQALKSFDAKRKKIITLDETAAELMPNAPFWPGVTQQYAAEGYNDIFIINGEIIYTKGIQAYYYGPSKFTIGKEISINKVRPDGTNKKVLKGRTVINTTSTFVQGFWSAWIAGYKIGVGSLYFTLSTDQDHPYKYISGQLQDSEKKSVDEIYQNYKLTIVSPSKKYTTWAEWIDGQSTVFLGDAKAENAKQIFRVKDVRPVGWIGDDYIILNDKNSGLSIMSTLGGTPLRVSDFTNIEGEWINAGEGYAY